MVTSWQQEEARAPLFIVFGWTTRKSQLCVFVLSWRWIIKMWIATDLLVQPLFKTSVHFISVQSACLSCVQSKRTFADKGRQQNESFVDPCVHAEAASKNCLLDKAFLRNAFDKAKLWRLCNELKVHTLGNTLILIFLPRIRQEDTTLMSLS